MLDRLSNEYLAMKLPALQARQMPSPGLTLLLDFGNTAQHG